MGTADHNIMGKGTSRQYVEKENNMEKVLVTQATLPPMDEYIEEIQSIWDGHWLTNMGPKHKQLQTELQKYLQVDNVELLVNGHMALELLLQAMDLEGEVITTPFTFASTTHAIIRNNLTPVFCDINPDDYTMDVSKIEELITDKTCAILPVHVYGNICNVEEIERIAKKHNLRVIYDAAHSFGETYKGIGVGNFGDASMFSFHATKVFNTIEGGAVSYHNAELGRILYNLKNFGIRNAEEVESVGANAKMNEFCAAMGICNLRHLEESIQKRKTVVERYRELLGDVKGVRLCPEQKDVVSNYSYFPILIDEEQLGADRDEVFEKLKEHDIFARKYFYPLTNSFDCFKGQFDPEKTPIALDISMRILTLPLYPDLPLAVVDQICEIITNI